MAEYGRRYNSIDGFLLTIFRLSLELFNSINECIGSTEIRFEFTFKLEPIQRKYEVSLTA